MRHGGKRWQPISEQLIPGPLRRARAAVASQVHAVARDGSSAAALDTAAASNGAVALGAHHFARQSNASVFGDVAPTGPSVSDMLLMRAKDIGALHCGCKYRALARTFDQTIRNDHRHIADMTVSCADRSMELPICSHNAWPDEQNGMPRHSAWCQSQGTYACTGAWAYDQTLWPPAHDLWRERLRLHANVVQPCPLSLHDIKFVPATPRDRRIRRWARAEGKSAGTAAALQGGKRKFRMADMQWHWGPQVRAALLKRGVHRLWSNRRQCRHVRLVT